MTGTTVGSVTKSAPQHTEGRLYLPGIDAMRGVLVIVGMLFHANSPLFQSGFFFVDVFGVLSGYLITRLLLGEYELTGRIGLKRFYLARARRLLPAFFLTIVLVILYARITQPNILGDLRMETLAAVGYFYNWFVIFTGSDYFSSYAVMPIQHLWTLSLEEQFYIIWPIALIGLFALVKTRRKAVPYLLLGGAALSVVISVVIYFGGNTANTTDFSRAPMEVFGYPVNRLMMTYMSTFTRAGGFMVGCAMAFWWQPERMKPTSRKVDRLIDGGGIVGLVAVMLLTNLQWFSDRVYAISVSGGQVAVWITCAVLIMSVTRTQSTMMHFLVTRKFFIRLGVVSYALYLFHWPIYQFYRQYPFKEVPLTLLVVWFPLIYAAAELSLKYLEKPIRRNGLAGWLRQLPGAVRFPIIGVASVAIGAAALSLLTAPDTVSSFQEETDTAIEEVSSISEPVERIIVGDSVILNAYKELEAAGVTVDGATSRTFLEGSQMVEFFIAEQIVTDSIVTHLGNSDPIEPDRLDAMLDAAKDLRRVVLVTLARPEAVFLDANNELLRAQPQERANVVVIDWQRITDSEPWLLRGDEVHISEAGFPAYAALVTAALADDARGVIGPEQAKQILAPYRPVAVGGN